MDVTDLSREFYASILERHLAEHKPVGDSIHSHAALYYTGFLKSIGVPGMIIPVIFLFALMDLLFPMLTGRVF